MKLKNYLYDRISLILVMIFSFVFLQIFLLLAGINKDIVFFVTIVYPSVFVVYFIIHYVYVRNKYSKLAKTMELLDKKYLLPEIVKKSYNFEQQFYMEMVRTASKSMMDEINEYEKQSIEYREYIENWIHEVKTPITAISLMCDNERNELTSRIKLETKRIEMDVERILYYSKSDEIWKDYVITKHNLKEIIEVSIMKIYQIFIYNGVKIDVQVENETVFTDAKWTSFIITQILLNCVQYKGENPLSIIISAKKKKEKTCLIIEDNGLGIKSEEIGHVFEKGYVGTNGRDYEKSSGMGMYICSKLCKKLNIGLYVNSEYGKYTRMIMEFGEGTFYSF